MLEDAARTLWKEETFRFVPARKADIAASVEG